MSVENTLTAFDNYIQENIPVLVEAFLKNTEVLNLLRKGEVEWDGEKAYILIETFRRGGFGFIDQDGSAELPDPAKRYSYRAHIPMAYAIQTMEVSHPVMKTMEHSDTVLGDFLAKEVANVMTALSLQVQNAVLSKEGAFATIPSVSGATTLTLTGILHDNPVKLQFVVPGDTIDIWDGTTKITRKVTGVDPDAGTITVDSAVTTSGTSYVAFPGALYNNSGTLTSRAFYGLDGVIDDDNPSFRSDFEGIDSSSNTWWRAVVNDNGGTLRALSLELIDQTIDSVMMYVADAEVPTIALADPAVRRKYINLLRDASTPTDVIVGEAGWKGVRYVYNAKPVVIVDHAKVPKNTIYFFRPDNLKTYNLGGPEPLEVQGSASAFLQGNTPVFRKYFYWYMNLGTPNRMTLAKLADISES